MKILKSSPGYIVGLSFLAGLAIPISTALQNVTLPLMVLTVLLFSQYRRRLALVCREPAILAALAFYALILIGCTWSVAPAHDQFKMLVKMIGLLELPFIIVFLSVGANRNSLLYGFGSACIATLFFSYVSILTQHPLFHERVWGLYYGVFRAHTYHCYFLALLGCYIAYQLLNQRYQKFWSKYSAIIILLLILCNIFFATYSRTGQILTLVMFISLLLQWRLKQGMLISMVILLLIVPALIYYSPAVNTKIKDYQRNIEQYQQGKVDSANPSMYLRWTFHKYAKMLIAERPLYGYGTGSYPSQYQRISAVHHNPFANSQPHSDYLWFGVELGYLGMLAFIALLGTILVRAFSLNSPERDFMLMIVLSYALSCIENSYFTDTVSGLAFIVFMALAFANKYRSALESIRHD